MCECLSERPISIVSHCIALHHFVLYHISLDRITLCIYVRLKKKNTCTGQAEASAEKSNPHKTVTPVRFSVTFSAGGEKGGGSCHGNGKVQSLTTPLECMMTCRVTYGAGASLTVNLRFIYGFYTTEAAAAASQRCNGSHLRLHSTDQNVFTKKPTRSSR